MLESLHEIVFRCNVDQVKVDEGQGGVVYMMFAFLCHDLTCSHQILYKINISSIFF